MKNEIIGLLNKLGIKYRWVDHPAVFTVAESMEYLKDKKPIKNLLLQEKNNGRKILIIMTGDQRLDTKLIAAHLGTRKLQFADADTLMSTFGVTPGAVSVFGLLNGESGDVEVVVDSELLKEPELGFHPNQNTATIFMPSSALEQIIKSTGHKYELIKL